MSSSAGAICPHGIVCDYVNEKTVIAGEEYVTGGRYWHNEDEPCDLRWIPEDVGAQLGRTGYCLHGYHEKCSHRVGGPADSGILLSTGQIYRCPCSCHELRHPIGRGPEPITQLSLFPERQAP
jgi:hypothetical protein